MTEYRYDGPQYPEEFFEEDELYWLGGNVYHVLAVADTKFGRLAWATVKLKNGQVDVATIHPSQYKDAVRISGYDY